MSRPELKRAVLAGAIALALVAPVCLDRIWEADTGFHVAVGRVLIHGNWVRANALSWIARDHPWHPPAWAYDALCAALEARFGVGGLQALTLFLAAAALAAVVALGAIAAPRVGPWLAPVFAAAFAGRFVPRPQLVTWLSLAAVLALCERGGRRGRLVALAIVVVANQFHSGAAFAAFALAAYCVEAAFRERSARDGALALAAVGSPLVHPGVTWQVRYLLDSATAGSALHTTELARTTHPLFFLAVALALVCAAQDFRRRPAAAFVSLCFAAAGGYAVRLVPEFALAALAPVARGLDRLSLRVSWARAALPAAALAAAAPAWLALVSGVRLGAAFEERVLPVRAAAFIETQALSGPHYNSMDDGGYLEMRGIDALIDGRLQAYPRAVLRDAIGASQTGASLDAWARRVGAEWALVPRAYLERELLDEVPGWALVYWDPTSAIWIRRDVHSLADLVRRLEYRHFRPDGRALVEVARGDRALLADVESEVRRYMREASDDVWPATVLCQVATREGRPAAPALCDRAAALASTERARTAVLLARRAPPLPP